MLGKCLKRDWPNSLRAKAGSFLGYGCHNLDTSILLDAYEKRGVNGEITLKLILKLIKEEAIIILSDLHIKELKDLNYSLNEINAIFQMFKLGEIKRVHINRNNLKESKQLASQKNIPKGDVLHAIISRDNDAIMISRDKHFKLLRFIETKMPKDLL